MKKQIIKIISLSFLVFGFWGFFNTVYADTTIHLDIKADTGSIYSKDINVEPCDSEGNGTMEITAYCALYQSGIASDWSGLWTNSINGIINNANNNGAYWMWLANLNTNNPYPDFNCHQDAPYSCSAKQYILNPNDNILFYYNIDPLTISASGGGPLVTPTVFAASYPKIPTTTNPTPTIDTTPTPTNTPPPAVVKPLFDTEKAFQFLTTQQQAGGSFGEGLYTDWAALTLASGNNQSQTLKLIKYLEEENTNSFSLTDNERHAMALMALGLDPYNTNGENYIRKIVSQFDGNQFGDPNEDNDDIFALIALQNAGYTQDDKIINDDIDFILKTQNENGSWNGSVDMTGASIEALSAFGQNEDVKNSLTKAEKFLKDNQNDDGGFGNASSTAWALEAILALNEKPEDWAKNGNTPLDYIASIQDADGGIKDANIKNKIWETSYVLSALSGKNWNDTMQKFEKPKETLVVEIKKDQITQNTEVKKIVTKKNTNLEIQNTATVLNAVTENTIAENKPTPKRNWFMRLLGNVFGF